MALNLRAIQKEMTRYLHRDLGLDDFEIEIEDYGDNLTAKNSITMKGFDDDIFVSFIVFKSGSFGVDFVFDKLDINQNSLMLMQEFNKTSVWLSAFIRNDGYLVLRYNVMELGQDEVIENVRSIFNQLLSDKIKGVLAPLLKYTYSA